MGPVFGLCFTTHSVTHYLVSYLVFNHFYEKERAGCINSIAVLLTASVLWLFLTVPWVGLQCVIVVFVAHSHLPSVLAF